MESDKIRNGKQKTNRKKTHKKKRSSFVPKFGCFRSDYDVPTVERLDGNGNFDMESASAGKDRSPTHLLIMVNGIIGRQAVRFEHNLLYAMISWELSAYETIRVTFHQNQFTDTALLVYRKQNTLLNNSQNWRYAAKQFLKKYPQDVVVHCSECNYSTLTFDGVDVMGIRLADEVISVIRRYPGLQKISFISHSLGGLVSRYAIAKLYGDVITGKSSQENGECRSDESKDPLPEEKFKGKIAGLEPMNFITSATPHLGSRGHKQTPAFCGFYSLEKAASRASGLLGRTGKHLFLRDGDNVKPPLLLQMANDTDDLLFISALRSFRRRVAYANAQYDYLVGWSTSSLRRRSELPRLQNLSRSNKYPHIVNVELAKPANTQEEISLETQANGCETIDMEEAMIRGLTKVSWERVDVDFSGTKQRLLAHVTIQVKTYCVNSAGVDVIQHKIDNFLV